MLNFPTTEKLRLKDCSDYKTQLHSETLSKKNNIKITLWKLQIPFITISWEHLDVRIYIPYFTWANKT